MKLSTTELTTLAYQQVRSMIRSNRLVAGQKIVQEKLAAELGISRTPLRSALQLLEGENLVVAIPRRGVFVRQYNDKEIKQIFDCRVALETTAARLFAASANDELIEELAATFEPFKGQKSINPAPYQKADVRFHKLLIDGCGNPFLQRLYKQGNVLICLDMIGLIRPAEATLPEHLAIIVAIRQRDGETAERLMRDHLTSSQIKLDSQRVGQ